ncbi:hypothetical protein [Sphingobium boeckii]|uniref:Tetratricopeptide repeat protein n=1 Tax=Sphingobium boeckii TaxID=1082345 RepID=A0A7W9EH11_9SPHN|nr:hypothetical protein [Sphingobium boeckii]MBB5687276.1 hypothetical protein [Sphingobium boeckii]
MRNLVSKAALGAALALGSLSMTVALPAHAAKEKKPKKGEEAAVATGPKLTLSKEFQAKLQPVVKSYSEGVALNQKLGAAAAADKPAIDAQRKAKWTEVKSGLDAMGPGTTPDEIYQINDIRLQAGIGLGDTSLQASAIDSMLSTNLVGPERLGVFQFYSGKFAYERKEYPRAEAAFNAAAASGYVNQELYLTQARLYSDAKRPADANIAMEKTVAELRKANTKVPEAYYTFGIQQAYNAKQMPSFVNWTTAQLRDYPTADMWRTNIQNYIGATKNMSADKKGLGGKVYLDAYRLLRAANAFAGDDDVYDYAYQANAAGLPLEAKAVLEPAKKSGKMSPEVNEFYTLVSGRAAGDQAAFAKISAQSTVSADADLALAGGDYAKAATIYQAAIAKGGLRDAEETQMRLGIALAMSGQKEPAKTAFQAVKGVRADIAKYWLTYLDVPPQPANPMTTGQ